MRYSTIISAAVAFAPAALAQSSSATITSMVPMMSPSAPPVTMAWNNEPSSTEKSALASKASSMNSAMQSAMSASRSMGMQMESGMTMSDGMVMATGSAQAAMGNFTGNAGKIEVGGGVAMMAAILAML
ncbi:hypothetical protein G6011_00282 [Alternaria panax]|uniref:Uncharacterized protein n=1 Tax=Alternaria panax TaxID=48097 RepID=A0AAD4IHX3_9PLEO|nr:hypothetical protein G6011_00282 [Alternaria panax]